MAEILYQGHGSLRLKTSNGKIVYIDPFAGEGYDQPADVILVTHQHMDHNRINKPAKKKDCVIIQNMDALVKGEYKSFNLQDIEIKAVPAYNNHHDRKECVGYLVTVDGVKIYFSGDTSETAEMKQMPPEKIDYVFLPTDGFFNMDIEEAVKCSEIIGAKHSIPIHMKPGFLFSERKAAKYNGVGKLVMKPGETIELK